MRKRTGEFESINSFAATMEALGNAAGHPSNDRLDKMAKTEHRRQVTLAVIDLALQPIVEVNLARQKLTEELSNSENLPEKSQMSLAEIIQLSEEGQSVIVYPFKR